jgi:hypothetical protein
MKRIFSIFLCAAFVFALSASLFAASQGVWNKYDQFDEDTVIDFRPSKDVSVYYDSDELVNYQEYIVGTKHTGGDTVYGAASGDSNIYKFPDSGYRGKEGEETGVEFPAFTNPADNESEMTWETQKWEKL